MVKRDEEMIGKIVAMEKYFWETHVLGGMEPVPDGSEATTNYFNSRFCESNGKTVELPEEALAVCMEYDRLSEDAVQIRKHERVFLALQKHVFLAYPDACALCKFPTHNRL